MRWWGWALVWGAAAVPFGVVVGRSIRQGDRPRYVPQLDVPLWHDTDLDGPPRRIAPAQSGDVLDDLWWHPEPPRDPGLFGAVQALAAAPDETAARYWLAVCARRGATWEQQRDLWDEWQRLHDSTVTYLRTDREGDL